MPRLLLLSNEPPHTGAPGAIFFHRLLRDYPPDHLLVISNQKPPPSCDRLDCRYVHLPLLVDRLRSTRFAHWRPILRALGGPRLVAASRIDAALAGFAPDVVITLMQDSWFYDLAGAFAFTRDLPLLLFAHDLAHGFEPVPDWVRTRQHERDQRVVRQACARLCISAPMAEFFVREFGTPAEVLWPPRSDHPVSQGPALAAKLRTPGHLTLGYAGGLHYGYGEQLLRMLPALRATGTRVELFTQPPGGGVASLAEATDVLSFRGFAPTPEGAWRGLLQRCDALLQPYANPAGKHELQYRTHFPSKLGDALSLGLPLLVTGPEWASGLAWCANRPGSALLVTEPDDTALIAALTRLRDDPAFRVELATRAQAAALELAAPTLREKFLRHVRDAAGA